MADVATHFPPQTYSSSFFLNSLGEEDEGGGHRKVRVRDKTTQDSSNLLDCFITKMFKRSSVFLPVLSLVHFALIPRAQGTECIDVSQPKTRVFASLKDLQSNKIPFDPSTSAFQGNYVSVRGPPIETVLKNSFISYDSKHIQRLSLDHLQIRNIESGAFTSLRCLSSLDLHSNLIGNISKGFLDGASALHELDLGQNLVGDVPDYVFSSLQQLRKLNLTRNAIAALHSDSFLGLNLLEELDLSYNRLQHILPAAFQYFKNLVNLQVGSNRLKQLDAETWLSVEKLKVLNVSDNELKSFASFEEFRFRATLLSLDLSRNFLTHLNPLALRRNLAALKSLDLDYNPWLCADLQTILRFFNESHVSYTRGVVKNAANVDGIACNVSIETYTKNPKWFQQETTTLASIDTTPSEKGLSSTEESVSSMAEMVQSVKKMQTAIICFFVILAIFITADIAVRTGCLDMVLKRRRNLFIDNADVENFSLLRDRN